MTEMKQQINVNDRVKPTNDLVYLKVMEVLPDDHYVVKLDSTDDDFEYIVSGDEIEFVRSANDKLIDMPEIGVIGITLKEEIEEDFDSLTDMWSLIAKTEFSAYKQKLLYSIEDKENEEVVVIYVKL